MTKKTDLFCPYHKNGLHIGSTPDAQAKIGMCFWQSDVCTGNVSFDHPYLQQMRQESKTKIPNACHPYCKNPDYFYNERVLSQGTWNYEDRLVIKKLHVELSLMCNLTCISCGTISSSAWNKDYHIFDPTAPRIKLFREPQKSWENLDLSSLEQLHITGGEPLLDPNNIQILEELDRIGQLPNVTLTYNTNGTILPNDRLLEYWAKSKYVRLFISLDGIENVFEYTRYPAKWDEVQRNIEYFRSLHSMCIMIDVDAIVGVHNIFNMHDFYIWWKNKCQIGSQGDQSRFLIRKIEPRSFGGQVLDLKYLPDDLRHDAITILEKLPPESGKQQVIDDVLLSPAATGYPWLEYFEKLDKLRNTNWKIMLPSQLQKFSK